MRLSIITVNYNNPEGLERTILSVSQQTCQDFEYIIVDGASTKGDVKIINKYQDKITKWVSEPDAGIYNAMNKAVRLATGTYCLFLNSGDTLYSSTTVSEIYSEELSEDFIEGRICHGGKLSVVPEKYTLGSYIWKRNNYHQGCLIKRLLLLKYPYDERFKISSDMRFNIEALVLHNCTFRPSSIIISNYEVGGRSTYIDHQDEIDAIFNDFFPPRVIEDYEDLIYLYDFPARYLMPFVRWIGRSYLLYNTKIYIKRLLKKKINHREYIELYKRKEKKYKKNYL